MPPSGGVVVRKQPERAAGRAAHGAEVRASEGEDVNGAVLFGEDDDRGVGQADGEVGVAAHDGGRGLDVGPAEARKLVGALRDLFQQGELRLLAVPIPSI